MSDYLWAAIYISLGFVGAIYHWFEKRYMHKTTQCNLWEYLSLHPVSTYKAASFITVSAIGLSSLHQGGMLSLAELSGILFVGYGFDNALNKAIDEEMNKTSAPDLKESRDIAVDIKLGMK